ncbi:unnamed protein product [Arabidopsis thaliana]|uniref:Uncharacterized protein n=1 Tax=Arabidopsis thaliana TaxID=3702 RepID=A0A5S9XS66_ARATH|nr:unnamed protein product [Arabidopsis thaliana]
MAESDPILRKKMRFSSSSVRYTTSQNLTASKLRTQSNRSSVRFASPLSHIVTDLRHHHASPIKGKIVTQMPRTCSRVTVKNLCLRRVFSPSSISSDWDFHVKGGNLTKELNVESPCDTPNSNVMREGSKYLVDGLVATGGDLEVVECSQTTPPDSEMFTGELSLVKNEAGSINQEISEVSGKKVGTNLGSKVIRHPEKIFKNPGSVSYRRMLPYLMEAADVTRDGDAKDPKDERGELMAANYRLPETVSANSFVKAHGNNSPFKKMISSSGNKISLCCRRKLFKVPGSVNYRRMLSYLKENSEDNHGTPETTHTDPQKNIEENASAIEAKGASNEVTDLDTCSNNVETPLADPKNEQETQLLLAEFSC